MRSLGLSALSLALTAVVIGNAFYQKKQFYPSVVYITKSNPSMAVIYIQFFVIVLMLGKLLRKIFLGTLRPAEFEHLMERFWYALTETCLAFTVFRDDFNPRFVALFTVLLFLKSFHWLAEERVDYMERSPVIGWLFHVRVASLLSVLGLLDYLMIVHAYESVALKGPTVQLVFGFEYAILITMVANTTVKYVLHAAELRADSPWENKAVFLLYTELVIGLIRVILYVLFVIIMAKIYALPMFVFRPMFFTMRNFKKALNDVIMSRRAIRNMNTLYPDATPEELAMSDNICIICREDMVSNSKKLPCGHIFHTTCLRSWFQRQQTCPTCRLNILRTPTNVTSSPPPPRPEGVNAPNINPNAGIQVPLPGFNMNNNNNNNNINIGQNPFTNLFAQNFGQAQAGATGANAGGNGTAGQVPPHVPPFVLPPFPFMAPYAIPPPPMPPNLNTLTDEELRALEGNERRHVEERLKLLQNVQLLLDAANSLMNQYSLVTARLPPIPAAATSSTVVPPSTAVSGAASTSSSTPTANSVSPEPSTSQAAFDPAAAKSATPKKDIITPVKSAQIDTNKPQSTLPEIEKDVRIEDLGSEEHADTVKHSQHNSTPTPSTSRQTSEVDPDDTELSEIRRRRLQKFQQQNDSVKTTTNE
ncbi:unnamed protein product [Hermetia illucens]|uniref:RING-type E3 ubiquitin transferase n=1 Tax=Hermetia illucens TaxID=343691 RepID=A0A7R8V5P4_HERIL|nr:E3 ubiquitin-protein ligase HRD1 isoform X2 [Hermetia illucens]CAD7092939.1 unnamed protein product [Hermetia illucens]